MHDPLQTAPPARRTFGSLVPLVVILTAVAAIVWLGTAQQGAESEDDTATLVILTLQAKALTAAGAIAPAAVEGELPKLDGLAVTPAVTRALAALNAYSGGDRGVVRARALLDSISAEEQLEEYELNRAVRTALEDPARLTEDERHLIRDHMAWFGKLLLSRTADPSDPLRREVEREGFRALLAMVGLLAGAGLGTLAGAGLLIAAFVLRGSGRFAPRFAAARVPGAVYLQAFSVYVAVLMLAMVVPALFGVTHPGPGLLGLVVASLLGLAWPALTGISPPTAAREIGLHRGEGWLREIGFGLTGYVAILPIVAAGFALSLILVALSQTAGAPGDEEAPRLISHPVAIWIAHGGTGTRLAVLFLASAFAPFFEEALFRGALYRAARSRFRPIVAGLLVGIVFAAIHPQGLLLVPALTALAFGFALIREWRDSLIAPMTGHAVHNGLLIGFMWFVLA